MDSTGGWNRTLLTLIFSLAFAVGMPGVPALSTQNDANLGVDAGNTVGSAAALPGFGSYSATLGPSDVDWYKVSTIASGPRCYSATSSSEQPARLGARFETATHSYNAVTRNAAGASAVSAIAVSQGGTFYMMRESATNQPTSYPFTLSEVTLPSVSAEDALTGTDAGSSLSTAIPISPGCTAGRLALSRLNDATDFYSFPLSANQQVTYAFAADAASPVKLALVDAAGNVLVPGIAPGGMATFTAPADGTYYLRAGADQQTFDEAAYFLSLVVGPPDPGNGCRPQC